MVRTGKKPETRLLLLTMRSFRTEQMPGPLCLLSSQLMQKASPTVWQRLPMFLVRMRWLLPSAPATLTALSLFRLSKRYTTHGLSLWEREGGRHCHYLLHMWKRAWNVDNPEEESQDGRHGVKVRRRRVHHPQGPAPGCWSVRVWI